MPGHGAVEYAQFFEEIEFEKVEGGKGGTAEVSCVEDKDGEESRWADYYGVEE